MSVIKYHHRPGMTFNRVFDEFFNTDFSKVLGNENFSSTAKANVRERDTGFVIELAAPGLTKEDFQLSVEKNLLTIKAEVKSENEENTDKYTRREFNYRSFNRSFRLPKSVLAENIEATYEDGVLKLLLPKREEAVQVVKEIEVK